MEDNLINQRVLKQQLTKHGYVAHVANHGQDALDFLKATRHWRDIENDENELYGIEGKDDKKIVDVILMDVEMPVSPTIPTVGLIEILLTANCNLGHGRFDVCEENSGTAKERKDQDGLPACHRCECKCEDRASTNGH